MPSFSSRSLARLNTCDERLQRVFLEVVRHVDCTILEGYRDEETQEEMVRQGKSKVHWPDGNHNKVPSRAVDAAPYPIDWEDAGRFYMFAGYVLATANMMGIRLRLGADWDGDFTLKDQSFNDLPHFELAEE